MWNDRTIRGQGAPSPAEETTDGTAAEADIVLAGEGADTFETNTQFFEFLLQSSPFAIFILDWKLKIVFLNRAFQRITGFRADDVTRGRLTLRVHPVDREETESSILMALVGRTAQCRCRIRGWNGALHSLELRFAPVMWRGRQLVMCADTKNTAGNS